MKSPNATDQDCNADSDGRKAIEDLWKSDLIVKKDPTESQPDPHEFTERHVFLLLFRSLEKSENLLRLLRLREKDFKDPLIP